jgi:membrane protease YdiL (CAAX protease family)
MIKKQLKPYHGILIFVLVILMLLFVATPIQMQLGMTGVVITELLILLFGIIPAILFKADLKEVIPVKRPTLRQVFGVVVLWIGSLLLIMVVTLVIAYLFPDGLFEVSNGLQEVFTSVPMLISFLIVAVSPAICEEVLVRGFILSSFSTLKNKWFTVVIVGILFGIFHLDPFRFLPTAILGVILSYIMVETKNILLPALFHFINNGFSTLTSFLTSGSTKADQTNMKVPLISVGVYFIIAAGVPFILFFGSKLLHPKTMITDMQEAELQRKKDSKTLWIALGCTFLMVIIGLAVMIYAASQPEFQDFMKEYTNI